MLIGKLCAVLLLASVTPGCAVGRSSDLTVSGTIRLVGNEPFSQVVLATVEGGGDFLLVGPLRDRLRREYQGQVVTLEGKTCKSPTPQFSRCLEPSRIVSPAAAE
jgi:hypothetical protein